MINLEIVTPEKMVVNEKVDTVRVPTANGEIGILAKHAPLISTLRPGVLSYSKGDSSDEMLVAGGFIEVSKDKVSILADIAERSSEIDVVSAKTERENATKILGVWKGSEEDFEAELERLEKAQARLKLAAKN